MIRRAWQVWTAFGLCLLLAAGALGWLTRKGRQLEKSEILARRQAELEQRVGTVLWQMDVEMTRLLAAEVGRPVAAYRAVLSSGEGKLRSQHPSPLLVSPSDLVLLHFQFDQLGKWQSPQCPAAEHLPLALDNGTSADRIAVSRQRLDQLAARTDRSQLLQLLPDQPIDTQWLEANRVVVMNRNQQPDQFDGTAGPGPQQINAAQSGALPQLAGPSQPAGASQQRSGGLQFAGPSQYAGPSQLGDPSQSFESRLNTLQMAAQQEGYNQQRQMMLDAPQPATPSRSMPIWSGDRLLIARRVESNGSVLVQGCWLDWPRLRQRLLEMALPLIPAADLAPLVDGDAAPKSRLLATLPVRLVTPALTAEMPHLTPMQWVLIAAWICLTVAAISLGLLLNGVMRLSERRAAFVSAVTHELRTPLTTFCMYSEMLADGMVQDEESRRSYLETLRQESNRLAHLVENVLQYARLERSQPAGELERLSLAELVDRLRGRIESRAAQAELQVDWRVDSQQLKSGLRTDPTTVEQIVFNLVDNACKYARRAERRSLEISLDCGPRQLQISVRDYGPGIAATDRGKMFRPFSRLAHRGAAPGVGLGLALCQRLATQLGGQLQFFPHQPGAEFRLLLPLSA